MRQRLVERQETLGEVAVLSSPAVVAYSLAAFRPNHNKATRDTVITWETSCLLLVSQSSTFDELLY